MGKFFGREPRCTREEIERQAQDAIDARVNLGRPPAEDWQPLEMRMDEIDHAIVARQADDQAIVARQADDQAIVARQADDQAIVARRHPEPEPMRAAEVRPPAEPVPARPRVGRRPVAARPRAD